MSKPTPMNTPAADDPKVAYLSCIDEVGRPVPLAEAVQRVRSGTASPGQLRVALVVELATPARRRRRAS